MSDRKKDVFYEAVDIWEKEHCMMIPLEAKIATHHFDYAYDKQQEVIDRQAETIKKLNQQIKDAKELSHRMAKHIDQLIDMIGGIEG